MRLLSRRRRREASHAGGFLSTATRCGASRISWSAGTCAKNRERERKRERKKGLWFSPEYDTHRKLMRTRNPSAAVRPSATEKEGPGISPDYDTTQHAHGKTIQAQSSVRRSGPEPKTFFKTSSCLTLTNQHRFQPLIDRIDRLKEHLMWQKSLHRPVTMARSYAG